jgi:hypothetical protein
MATLAKLLAQKQRLIERLDEIPGANERAQIKRLLAEIDGELNLLDQVGSGIANNRDP